MTEGEVKETFCFLRDLCNLALMVLRVLIEAQSQRNRSFQIDQLKISTKIIIILILIILIILLLLLLFL